MNLTKVSLTATAVLVLGVTAPGCARAPDPSLGSYCASPGEGGEFCVSANQSPAGAWNQAERNGKPPIQMWATWPSTVPLDALIGSTEKLKAWFADTDTAFAYVRDTKQNAESYQASLSGNGLALLRQVKQRQADAGTWMPVDAVGNFKAALHQKASTENGSLPMDLALDKQRMTEAQAIFDNRKANTAFFSTIYATIAARFIAYRATETGETAKYVALSQKASQSTLATIPDVEQEVLQVAQDIGGEPYDLSMFAMKLAADILAVEGASASAMKPYQDLLAAHALQIPDMTSAALRSLNSMLGYIQRRMARSDATAITLLDGLAMRKQALTLLAQSQPFRDKVAQAEMLKAGAVFKADAEARVDAFTAGPPMSTTMKLPYLAARYDQLTQMLQIEPLCDPASSSWREDGCVLLRASFPDAKAYLKTTLPALIHAGIATMRAQGMDAMLLDAAQSKLDVGDVKSAAMAYDAAVRSTEGT